MAKVSLPLGGGRRLSVAMALALTFAGCGDDQRAVAPAPQPPLTEAERANVRQLEMRLQRHCVQVSKSLVDPSAAPEPEQERAAFAAADELVALAARSPRAPLDAGQDLRLFLSDVVENFEGSNCDPRIVARLEQGLGRIPVE